ncbi:phospholipase D family protein [Paraburkholderia steynii]|uniref:phospholipase D family protein n=1 Tax=Paraburkholderia steynii TaxID=1245441 RepID=UPI000B84A857|nr:phospholipase D family protein [Paraburkholderia steynii]
MDGGGSPERPFRIGDRGNEIAGCRRYPTREENVFITAATYHDQVLKLVDSGEPVSAAVAFVGQGCDEILGRSTASVRLLCNLLSGGTNPRAIQALKAYRGIEIRHLRNLHAKVIIGDTSAIIGSANLSENGLTTNPDMGSGWHEAGWLVNDRDSLRDMDAWYQKLWAAALQVTDDDLKQAEAMWGDQNTAAFVSSGRSGARFADVHRQQVDGVPIYMCIYSDDASERAVKAASTKLSDIERSGSVVPSVSPYEIFDGWSSLPSDGPLLCFRIRANGSLVSEGAWKYISELDTSYSHRGQRHNVFFASRVRKVLEWKYGPADAKLLASALEGASESILAKHDRKGYISLHEALTIAGVDRLRD